MGTKAEEDIEAARERHLILECQVAATLGAALAQGRNAATPAGVWNAYADIMKLIRDNPQQIDIYNPSTFVP